MTQKNKYTYKRPYETSLAVLQSRKKNTDFQKLQSFHYYVLRLRSGASSYEHNKTLDV